MLIAQVKVWVLAELYERESSGYDILKKIGSINGKTPSPGYIYPLLNDLKNKGFVSMKEKERTKLYSITPKGRKLFKELEEARKKAITSLLKPLKPLAEKEERAKLEKMMKTMTKNKQIIMFDKEALYEFHESFFKISKSDDNKRREAGAILREATKKLKELEKR